MRYDDFEELRITISDKIAEWQIIRPEKLNAMRHKTFWEIMENPGNSGIGCEDHSGQHSSLNAAW